MNTDKEKRAANIRIETGCKGQKTQKKSALNKTEAYFPKEHRQSRADVGHHHHWEPRFLS